MLNQTIGPDITDFQECLNELTINSHSTITPQSYSQNITFNGALKPEIISETEKSENIDDKMINNDFIQKTIKKNIEAKELLLRDTLLNNYSLGILDEIKSVFNSTSSVESYSIELTKDKFDDTDDNLIIYVYLSKKVSFNEMMDLWKRISVKSVNVVKEITKSSREFQDVLERTTVTLKRG